MLILLRRTDLTCMYLDAPYWLFQLLCVDDCQEFVRNVSEYIKLLIEECLAVPNSEKSIDFRLKNIQRLETSWWGPLA